MGVAATRGRHLSFVPATGGRGSPSVVVCDTCGRQTDQVYRVVIDRGYDRSSDAPLYNCRECFEKKNAERAAQAAAPPEREQS